jgi:hypothetical protein
MLYKGSCHCGNVAFEVEGDLAAVVNCNCSICSRKGALLWAVPRERLNLVSGTDGLARYAFNERKIVHRFCTTCGVHPFAEDAGDDRGRSAYVNVRCLEAVDPASLEQIDFNGRSM